MGQTLDILAEVLGACADMDRLFSQTYVQLRRNCNWMLAGHLKMPQEPIILDADNFGNNCRTLAEETKLLAAACTAIARMSAGMEPDDLFSEYANRFEKHSARFAISALFWSAYPHGEWSYSSSRDPAEHARLTAERSADAERIVREIRGAQEESQVLLWEQAVGVVVAQTQTTDELSELARRWKNKADRMCTLFKLRSGMAAPFSSLFGDHGPLGGPGAAGGGIRFGPPGGGPPGDSGPSEPPIRFD